MPYLFIIVTLNPSHQTKNNENLGLDAQGNIELLYDVIDSQRYSSPSPKHHHSWLQPDGIVPTIINDDLRDQLDRPADLHGSARDKKEERGERTAPRVPSTFAAAGTSIILNKRRCRGWARQRTSGRRWKTVTLREPELYSNKYYERNSKACLADLEA